MKKVEYVNSVDSDEVAHTEPPHLNICFCTLIFEFLEMVKLAQNAVFFFNKFCRCK